MNARFSIENMSNGLTLIRDRANGLQGCYDSHTGAYRHGDLHAVRISPVTDSFGFRAAMLGAELVGYFDIDESGFYASRSLKNVVCEVCGRQWDTISPCALCNASRSISSGRI